MSAVSSPTIESALSTTIDTQTTATKKADESESILLFTSGLPAREVHRRAQAACRLQGKAHHLLAHWMLEVEERKLHLELGYSSVYQYAELSLHLEGHTVAEYLRTGRALKNFPLLSEAYQNGSLSASKLREITRVVEKDTERFWLEKALNSTTRQIEKMVVFSPRQRCAGDVAVSVQQHSSQRDCPSATLHSSSTTQTTDPTVGFQEQLIPPSSQGDSPQVDSPPAHGREEMGFPSSTMHKVEDTPPLVCCSENLAAPQAHADFHEAQVLTDIPPRKYLEKIVLELSGEQAAIVQDAFRKARKESGLSDRASLVTYLARVFLEGREEPRGQHSPKSPYQVVLHHQSGITWTESERGPVYVPDTVCEKALCDAEIVEVETAADECRHERAEGVSPSVSSRDSEGECVSPGERVNRLFQFYRQKAREGNEADTGKPRTQSKPAKSSTRTMPLSLRKKVLLRDGGRCQAPGCGRTRFVEVHHVLPIGAGGDHTAANTLVMCHSCHARVHEGTLTIEGEAPGKLRWRRGR